MSWRYTNPCPPPEGLLLTLHSGNVLCQRLPVSVDTFSAGFCFVSTKNLAEDWLHLLWGKTRETQTTKEKATPRWTDIRR